MSKSPPEKPVKNVQGSVRLPLSIRDELKDHAHAKRTTVSVILRDIVAEYAAPEPTEWAPPVVSEKRPTLLFTIDPRVLERAQKRAEAENIPLAQTVQQRIVDLLAPL